MNKKFNLEVISRQSSVYENIQMELPPRIGKINAYMI